MAIAKSFKELRTIFQEVLELKNSANEQDAQDVNSDIFNEKRKYGSLAMVVLKKVNRMDKYKLREKRDELHKEKIQGDINRLQLQNLLYEVNHLAREIRYCRQFKSQDEEVELMSFEDYSKLCEEDFSFPNDEHKRRLMHLECELKLRRKLSKQCKLLLNSKKEVFQDIVSSAEKLASFGPHLKSLMQASLPLQETLQMQVYNEWKLRKLVQLLPQPLYIAYVNLHALQQFDININVKVLGTEEDVHSLEFCTHMAELKHYLKTCSKTQLSEEEKYKFLVPHPLIIRFVVGSEQNMENNLCIDLRYFPELGFVTAAWEAQFKDSDITAEEITTNREILSYIFENDYGDCIPLEELQYKLLKINISAEECLNHLKLKNNGKPYKWLQRLCCLIDPTASTKSAANTALNSNNSSLNAATISTNTKFHKVVPEIIAQIQAAWKSHNNLIQQIRLVSGKNGEQAAQHGCSLVQWSSLSWEQYNAAIAAISAQYIQNLNIDAHDIFYRAIFVHGSAKLECLISISHKFPMQSPIWVLSIHCNNGHHNSHNNTSLKILEYLTNSISEDEQSEIANASTEGVAKQLIAKQLNAVLHNFNVFLQSDIHNAEHSKNNYALGGAKRVFSKRIRTLNYAFEQA